MPPVVAPTYRSAPRRGSGSRPAWRHAWSAAPSAKRSARDSRRTVAGGSSHVPTPIPSGTCAATAHRPTCVNCVSGPIPERPSTIAAARAPTSAPSAVTAPRPAIATPAATSLPDPLSQDEVDQRVDRRERFLADLFVRDRDTEAPLDQHDQLERVDRIEAEPLAEDGRVVLDVGRRRLEPEPADEQVFHLGLQSAPVHRATPFRASRAHRPRAPVLEHREPTIDMPRS